MTLGERTEIMAQRFVWGGALTVAAVAAVLCLSAVAVQLQIARGHSPVELLNLKLHPAASYFLQSLSHLSNRAHKEIKEGKADRKDAERWDSSMIGAFKTFQSLSKVTNENLKGKLHAKPSTSDDSPSPSAKTERKQTTLASLHNLHDQFRPETFKDPQGLSDGIPSDMFTSEKSRTTQLLQAHHNPTRARGNMVVENHNGIPELHLRVKDPNSPAAPAAAAPRQTIQTQPSRARPAPSHQQHLAAAAPPARPQRVPAARHGGRRVRRISAPFGHQTVSQEGTGVGAIGSDEDADAMTTLQNAMTDATQETPGHVEPVRQQQSVDPTQQQQPFESYFAYKWRIAHGGGFPE